MAAANPVSEASLAEGARVKRRRRFAQAALLITGITIFSRLLGLIREALIAGYFGVGPQTDAFFVAFKVPDIIFNSLMNFFVATCFVPIFTETLTVEGTESSSRLATSVFSVMVITLGLVSLLMMVFAPPLIHLLAPGLPPSSFPLTVRLMRVMTPIIVFGGLVGLSKSILNTFQQYLVPAFVSVVYNVVMIGFIWLLGRRLGVEAMAWGLLISAVLQLLLFVPSLRTLPLRWLTSHSLDSQKKATRDKVRRIGQLAIPVLLAMLLGNLNAFIETYLASGLAQGSISYLSYAYRIFTVPEQIFTIVVSTIVFPVFASDVAKKDWAPLLAKALRVLGFTAVAVLPLSVLVICGSREIVGLMLGRGAFSVSSVNNTASALATFTAGLFSVCARSLITFIFFALQDTRFLLKLTAVMVPLQLGIDVILIRFLSFNGLALGNSLAATIHLAILLVVLKGRLPQTRLSPTCVTLAKACLASVLMFLAAEFFRLHFFTWQVLPTSASQFAVLLIGAAVACTVYLSTGWLLRMPEVQLVWQRTRISATAFRRRYLNAR